MACLPSVGIVLPPPPPPRLVFRDSQDPTVESDPGGGWDSFSLVAPVYSVPAHSLAALSLLTALGFFDSQEVHGVPKLLVAQDS